VSASASSILPCHVPRLSRCARRSETVRWRQVFRQMDAAQQRIRILDWGVANATLEEVFVKFAQSIGAEGGS